MHSLLAKLIAVILIFLVLHSVLTFSLTSVMYGDVVSDNILEEARRRLQQINVNLDTLVNTAVSASNLLGNELEFTGLLKQSSQISTAEITLSSSPDFPRWYLDVAYPLKKKIHATNSAMLYQYNASVLLVDNNGVYYTAANSGFLGQDESGLIRRATESRGYIVYGVPAAEFDFFSGMSERSLLIAQALRHGMSANCVGTLLVALEFPESLAEAFEPMESGQSLVLLDENGRLVIGGGRYTENVQWETLSLRDDGITTLSVNGDACYLISTQNDRTGWTLVQLIPRSVLFAELDTLRTMILGMLILLSLLELTLLFLVIRHAMKPLKNLNTLVNRVGEGDFSITAPVRGRDEVAQISANFNLMVRRVDQLVCYNKLQHQLRERAMLDTLRAQINPHFLLNTLNDIKWTAIIHQDQEVAKLLSTLGGLLETSLGRNSTFVTLDEELRYTEKYIELANLRFNNRLVMKQEVCPEAKLLYIPVLLLQPLIENVTSHGLREDEDVEIRIAATVGETLVISVTDNGNGIAPERLDEIRRSLNDFTVLNRKNIGVNNVHKRIVLTYGEGYGLSIDSVLGKGTAVRVTLPVQTERREDLAQ